MKLIVKAAALSVALVTSPARAQQTTTTLDAPAAGRLAALALACVQKEYPNKIAHVLNSPDDIKAPHELTPSFYGCYDWHSSVHGHWLLARLVRTFPEYGAAQAVQLQQSVFPDWIDGHGTEPYEQNTQQSPGFGRSNT